MAGNVKVKQIWKLPRTLTCISQLSSAVSVEQQSGLGGTVLVGGVDEHESEPSRDLLYFNTNRFLG
jgi:hypothetical protein